MRRLIVMAALATAGLTMTACSSGSAGRSVANLHGHSGTSRPALALTTAQADQDFVNFAHCMRAHGVAEPDPFHRPGHSGLSIEVPQHTQANRPAWAACQHFIQPVIAMKQAGARALPAARLAALTRYAQCMRANDISMLDPTSFGALNLGHVPGITSNYGRYSPQFRAADATCRHLLPAGVHDNGTGP